MNCPTYIEWLALAGTVSLGFLAIVIVSLLVMLMTERK